MAIHNDKKKRGLVIWNQNAECLSLILEENLEPGGRKKIVTAQIYALLTKNLQNEKIPNIFYQSLLLSYVGLKTHESISLCILVLSICRGPCKLPRKPADGDDLECVFPNDKFGKQIVLKEYLLITSTPCPNCGKDFLGGLWGCQ